MVQARMARGDRRRPPPPDLPSLLFDQRIVYLGMPVSRACVGGSVGMDLSGPLATTQQYNSPKQHNLQEQQHCMPDLPPWRVCVHTFPPQPPPLPVLLQLVPAVTELMVAELLYLEKQGQSLPIEMLINSSGTTRQDGEIVSRPWLLLQNTHSTGTAA